jgi:hypothetical protein
LYDPILELDEEGGGGGGLCTEVHNIKDTNPTKLQTFIVKLINVSSVGNRKV